MIQNTQLGALELSRGPRLAGFAAADVPAAGTPRAAGGTGRRLLQTAPNKFTCLVESSWMSPFDSPEFRHPQIRGPLCYNPYETRRPGWRQPEPGPMSFMMSRDRYLGHVQGPGISHLMFHAPKPRPRKPTFGTLPWSSTTAKFLSPKPSSSRPQATGWTEQRRRFYSGYPLWRRHSNAHLHHTFFCPQLRAATLAA